MKFEPKTAKWLTWTLLAVLGAVSIIIFLAVLQADPMPTTGMLALFAALVGIFGVHVGHSGLALLVPIGLLLAILAVLAFFATWLSNPRPWPDFAAFLIALFFVGGIHVAHVQGILGFNGATVGIGLFLFVLCGVGVYIWSLIIDPISAQDLSTVLAGAVGVFSVHIGHAARRLAD